MAGTSSAKTRFALLPGHDGTGYATGTPVFRAGSISSGRGPDSRLCMWTMKALSLIHI